MEPGISRALMLLALVGVCQGSVAAEDGPTLAHFREAFRGRLYVQALWNSLVLGAWIVRRDPLPRMACLHTAATLILNRAKQRHDIADEEAHGLAPTGD